MDYIVGIDLGTTNTVVYYQEIGGVNGEKPKCFKIPQLVNRGEIESLSALPSCIYIASDDELKDDSLLLPWQSGVDKYIIGAFASKLGSEKPTQVVSSAKSWLCAENIDRLAKVLPIEQEKSELKISPVEASSLILRHIKDAWNNHFGTKVKFEKQQIILAVPASFDAVARELTVKAASEVGISNLSLLEEPQAAFYSWINKHENWRNSVVPGDLVLVCDIGGGTTDFSLIEAKEESGNLVLERSAVGRHILLGGDNLDLTMAYMAQSKFKKDHNSILSKTQFSALVHSCRYAKEKLLADVSEEKCSLTVLGSGSSVIGGSLSVELTRAEVEAVVV
ncbi:MAG: Hsp70 family protein, partial [Lentisphaeria bacterium]